MFSGQAQEHDYDSENIVYEPVDDDEVEHDEGKTFVLLIVFCLAVFCDLILIQFFKRLL